MTPLVTRHIAPDRAEPADLLLSASLAIAPLAYLVTDSLYAVRGWDDGDAGGLHVIAAIAYGFVLLRLASWSHGRLQAAMLFAAIVGTAGNVAYGFNTIQVSLGAIDLVDTSGPGAIIKPLGLFFPIALLLGAVILKQTGRVPSALLVGLSALAWPIAHIANIAWLAVAVNLALVAALVPLARTRPNATQPPTPHTRSREPV